MKIPHRSAAIAFALFAICIGLLTTQHVARAEPSADVTIADFAFTPTALTVTAGTKVTWINKDSQRHTVAFPDQTSSMLGNGATFSKTFAEPGEFSYKCSRHENMTGKIIVKKAE